MSGQAPGLTKHSSTGGGAEAVGPRAWLGSGVESGPFGAVTASDGGCNGTRSRTRAAGEGTTELGDRGSTTPCAAATVTVVHGLANSCWSCPILAFSATMVARSLRNQPIHPSARRVSALCKRDAEGLPIGCRRRSDSGHMNVTTARGEVCTGFSRALCVGLMARLGGSRTTGAHGARLWHRWCQRRHISVCLSASVLLIT